MFEDYRKVVFAAYVQQRDEGSLSSNLQSLTPAKFKAECRIVYQERPLKMDEKMLRVFFGPKDDAADYSQKIEHVDIDRFRPLINFLKGSITVTDNKNIELLAWLIDFKPRTFDLWKDSAGKLNEMSDVTEHNRSPSKIATPAESKQIDLHTDQQDRAARQNFSFAGPSQGGDTGFGTKDSSTAERTVKGQLSKASRKKVLYAFLAAILVFGGSYSFYKIGDEQCMYWTGDHYQPISCRSQLIGARIIALDNFKVDHVKKITRPDTITRNSIRKIWYAKVKGVPEFFTDSTAHPTDDNKRMLPMTEYMFTKYIAHQK